MNISLASAADKQQKKKAKYGLTSKSVTVSSNVFGDDDDDEDADEEMNETGRDQVNRDLLREQDALRQRASAAMYDFDGTYQDHKVEEEAKKEEKKKESRYMKDLMEQAKKRNYERDMAHERKLAKEQEAEDGEFRGKEKFITSAYKEKLQERELWKQEEEQQRERDEKEDVTKRKDGLSGFYGNFNNNVAVGGRTTVTADHGERKEEQPSFLDGFEAADDGGNNTKNDDTIRDSEPSFLDGFEASATPGDEATKSKTEQSKEEELKPTKSRRQIRDEKMAEARLRYFQRRGITEQEASQEVY